MLWTPQVKAALMRAIIGSVMAFGATAGVAEALTNGQWRIAATLGGTAVVTYLVMRGGLEGLYDAYREAIGNVKPGDIQAYPTKMAIEEVPNPHPIGGPVITPADRPTSVNVPPPTT